MRKLILLSMLAWGLAEAACDVELFEAIPFVLKADCGVPVSDVTFYQANTPVPKLLQRIDLPISPLPGIVYYVLPAVASGTTTYGATANDGSVLFGKVFTIHGSDAAPPPPSPCVYTYSSWGACQVGGTQTRTITASAPAACVGTPILSQACTYTPPPRPPPGAPPFPWTIGDVVYTSQAQFDTAVASGVFGSQAVRVNKVTVHPGFGPGIDGTSP